jgi:hypothetical protein
LNSSPIVQDFLPFVNRNLLLKYGKKQEKDAVAKPQRLEKS